MGNGQRGSAGDVHILQGRGRGQRARGVGVRGRGNSQIINWDLTWLLLPLWYRRDSCGRHMHLQRTGTVGHLYSGTVP